MDGCGNETPDVELAHCGAMLRIACDFVTPPERALTTIASADFVPAKRPSRADVDAGDTNN